MNLQADVIVAGGGLNGLATAVALAGPAAGLPLDVTLIDAGDPARYRDPVADGRASAITSSSRRMLEVLGVWADLAPHAQPMTEIIVTDEAGQVGARPVLLHFDPKGSSEEGTHSWMIENHHLYSALHSAAEGSKSITLMGGTAIENFAFDASAASVQLSDGRTLKASLIAAADGRASSARQSAGVSTFGWDYGQSGIVTTVGHEKPHHGRAEEHFRPTGPFAILPLTGNRSSIVWTEGRSEADRLVALPRSDFEAELRMRFGDHLGHVDLLGPQQAWPLSLSIARSFISQRLALIGDAAHVVHPLAGLGFNLGLRDIAALAEVVTDQVRIGLDPGDALVLERYQAWRRFDTALVAIMTDGLNRLFSNDSPGLAGLRQAGLRLVDRAPPLKEFLAGEAAGSGGRSPKLLQGEPV